MKALSIRQPWAWLIVEGIKNIENRSWDTKHRGRFLIHASSYNNKKEYENLAWRIIAEHNISVPPSEEVLRGGIIGSAYLQNVIQPTSESPFAWHDHNCYGFKLTDAVRKPFQACKGQLNFFEVKGKVDSEYIKRTGKKP